MSNRYGYELGAAGGPGVAGPLIGGGVTQVTSMAARMLGKSKPAVVKWSGAIGLGVGLAVGGVLAARRRTRSTGISALITAALVGLPPLIEGAMSGTFKGGYLGVVTAEQGLGADGIDLLGVVTAEQEAMNGADGIDLLGSGGAFGSNFWAQQ